MIHDARIDKPTTATKGPHKGLSDPVLVYDWDGLYGIAFWDETDQAWHEINDGREEIYTDGIRWWSNIPKPSGWNYDSDYYSSGFVAQKFREEKEAMEAMGFRVPHRYRSDFLFKGEDDGTKNHDS